jgi:hypothetical protein
MRAFIDGLERVLGMVLLAIVWCLTVETKTQHHNRKSHPAISKYSTKFRHQSINNGGKQQLAQRGSHHYFQKFLTNTYQMIVRLLSRSTPRNTVTKRKMNKRFSSGVPTRISHTYRTGLAETE